MNANGIRPEFGCKLRRMVPPHDLKNLAAGRSPGSVRKAPGRVSDRPSSVDRDICTRNVAGSIAAQKNKRPNQVLRLARPAHRDLGGYRFSERRVAVARGIGPHQLEPVQRLETTFSVTPRWPISRAIDLTAVNCAALRDA